MMRNTYLILLAVSFCSFWACEKQSLELPLPAHTTVAGTGQWMAGGQLSPYQGHWLVAAAVRGADETDYDLQMLEFTAAGTWVPHARETAEGIDYPMDMIPATDGGVWLAYIRRLHLDITELHIRKLGPQLQQEWEVVFSAPGYHPVKSAIKLFPDPGTDSLVLSELKNGTCTLRKIGPGGQFREFDKFACTRATLPAQMPDGNLVMYFNTQNTLNLRIYKAANNTPTVHPLTSWAEYAPNQEISCGADYQVRLARYGREGTQELYDYDTNGVRAQGTTIRLSGVSGICQTYHVIGQGTRGTTLHAIRHYSGSRPGFSIVEADSMLNTRLVMQFTSPSAPHFSDMALDGSGRVAYCGYGKLDSDISDLFITTP